MIPLSLQILVLSMPNPKKNFTQSQRKQGGFASLVQFFPKNQVHASRQCWNSHAKSCVAHSEDLALLDSTMNPTPTMNPTVTAPVTRGHAVDKRVRSKKKRKASLLATRDGGGEGQLKSPPESLQLVTLSTQSAASVAAKIAAANGLPAASTAKPKAKRKCHGNDDKMGEAVGEWDRIKILPNRPTKKAFAKSRGINPHSFQKYAHNDLSKRRTSGSKAGRPSIVTDGNAEFVIQHAIRADRANDGFTASQVIHNLQQLQPELAPLQASN